MAFLQCAVTQDSVWHPNPQTGTINQCYYPFYASPGDSVTIVYLPDDPTVIAPPGGLLANVQLELIGTILSGLITLILLPFWIRKRIRMASLKDQLEQNATVAEDAKGQEGTKEYHPNITEYPRWTGD